MYIYQAKLYYNTVNQTPDFVDLDTGAQTQNTKRLRGSAKWDNKEHHGPNRNFLDSYLAGFLWRTGLNGQDAFETI